MSKTTVNSEKTDNLCNLGRQEESRREENRDFFLQVINDFDGRVGDKLFNLRARLNEPWDNEDSRAPPPQSQEYLQEEIKRLSFINENLEKRQRSLEQKVKKPKKPPHERMLRCVSKGFKKLKKSVGGKTSKSTEISTDNANNYKMDTQTTSAYSSQTSIPSSVKWSSSKPRIFSVQETNETEQEHTDRRENIRFSVGAANERIHSSPTGQRCNFRCRTKSEIKSDPKFSTYLLKWPPAESNLKPALKKSAPARPVSPFAPVALVGPAGPVTPVTPVAQVGLVGPVRPVAPVAPVVPAGPIGPIGPVQERTEGRDHCVDLSIAGMCSTPKAPRVNFKTRTVSEIRRDPHFSNFLLKWPPESSRLNPIPNMCGTNKYSENWEKDVKKGQKLVGRFDLRKVGMPSSKHCETLTQDAYEDAESRDVGRLRMPSQPQTQHRLLGGSESPDSCEHFMSRYTLKSGLNTSEASWETESKDWPEDLSSVQSQKSVIQFGAAGVSKHLENAATAKVCWTNHIKELENEAKSLEKELKDIDKKIEPRKPTMVSQGKGIHTKKFKRKLKK